MEKTCSIEGCERKCYAKDMCNTHWTRWRKNGNPKSEEPIRRSEKHGMTATGLYFVWQHMLQRCYNPNHKTYHRYGGRGITICNRWRSSFLAFYHDMGALPGSQYEIDRIDNDGPYELANCQWAIHRENMQHTSTTKLDINKVQSIRELGKKGLSDKEIGEKFGVHRKTIYAILKGTAWRE